MRDTVFVFDLDDTLTSERDYCLSGFLAVGQYLALRYQVQGFTETASTLLASGRRGMIFNEALDQLGFGELSPHIPELVEVYRDHIPSIVLYEDAEQVLRHLRSTGHPTAIITDGYLMAQRRKIAALGLDELVDYALCTDELGREHWKPSPVPYQRIMERFSTCCSQFVYVGDNPHKDFITARRLGWKTYQIQRPDAVHPHSPPTPDHAADQVITDLSRLLEPPEHPCVSTRKY